MVNDWFNYTSKFDLLCVIGWLTFTLLGVIWFHLAEARDYRSQLKQAKLDLIRVLGDKNALTMKLELRDETSLTQHFSTYEQWINANRARIDDNKSVELVPSDREPNVNDMALASWRSKHKPVFDGRTSLQLIHADAIGYTD